MKTILVIYTHTKLSKQDAQTMKRYSFNTISKVKVGDMLSIPRYTTPVQVVEILPKCYKYVDTSNGELSNTRKPSTMQYEIRVINPVKKEKVVEDILDSEFLEEY